MKDRARSRAGEDSLAVNIRFVVTLAFFSYLGLKEILNIIRGLSPIASG